jgi:predicted lipoprotein with Yx(FWY)xxD motif
MRRQPSRRHHRLPRLGAWLALAALTALAAGCGGGGQETGPQPASAPAGGGAVVAARGTDLGRVLVDGQGRTLYLFEKDMGGRSACSGACAAAWPPVTTGGRPRAGEGARPGLLGTTARPDGGRQVTYAGHPLYRYAGDRRPGDTTGQDVHQFGAEWYALGADGRKAQARPSGGGGAYSSRGGGY